MQPIKTIAFNTGRQYTAKGQRVAAALLDTGDIVFYDCDRVVYGMIGSVLSADETLDLGLFTQHWVMDDYDKNQYTNDVGDNHELLNQLRDTAEQVK